MNFLVNSGALAGHIQAVAKAINSKSVNLIPVLSNILFELKGDTLTLTGSDANNRLSSSIEVTNKGEDGCFLVSDRIIIDALRELPDQPITIDVDANSYHAKLQYSNGFYDFLASNADSYPATIELNDQSNSIELTAESLLEGLNAAKVAAGTDERRPIMTGVLLDLQTDKITYVASDGRILVRHTDHRVSAPQAARLTLPPAVYKILTGTILAKENGAVRINFDDKHIQFVLNSFTLTARLLEGTYPAYNSVIPPSSPHQIIVGREALLYAAKRISLFANKASKLILFDIYPDKINLKANDIDFSTSAEESIACQAESVEHLRIGFDFDLLRILLDSIDSEQIQIDLSDQTRAGIITPITTKEGVEVLALIIPLKLIGDF